MNGQFHVNAESSILRQTAAPNAAACAVKLCRAMEDCPHPMYCGEHGCERNDAARSALPIALLSSEPDFEVVDGPLYRLMREGSDEKYRTELETLAFDVGNGAIGPVFDVSQLAPEADPDCDDTDEERQTKLAKAVRYLDLRGLLVRTVAGSPQLVSLRRV